MRVTSKGQVTIPKAVRDKLGITPGTDVGFSEDGALVVTGYDKPVEGESRGAKMARQLLEFGDRMRREGKIDPYYANMTTDQIMEELRGYSEDENDPGFKRSV